MGVWKLRTMYEGRGSGRREKEIVELGRVVMYVFKLRSVTDLAVYIIINGASSTPFLLTGLYTGTINIYHHEIDALIKTSEVVKGPFFLERIGSSRLRLENFQLQVSILSVAYLERAEASARVVFVVGSRC